MLPELGTNTETAIELTNGQNYNEEFFSYNEDRWFKFTATEHDGNIGGYTLSGIMSCDFTATLFDSDGNEIQPVHVAVNQRDFCYWCTMSTNETYYLRVTSMSENGGSFYVNASETPSILNKGSSMADAITMYNIYTPVEGAITTPGEEKWYKLTVDGDYDKIIVHSCDSEIELQAELYTADNELICSDTEEDSNVNFRMEPEVTPFYTYYLKVTGKDNATGSFKVRWSSGFYAEAINLPVAPPYIKIGTVINLSSAITPINTLDLWINWKSSNDEIAKIDRYGCVTVINPGKFSITAKSQGVESTFSSQAYIHAKSVSFTNDKYNAHKGSELHLTLTTIPAHASMIGVNFISSNPNVVDFDADTLTLIAKEQGTATLTVYPGGEINTCEVVVRSGVGGEYRQVDTAQPNCFGYALFKDEDVNPNPANKPDSHLTEDFAYKIEGVFESHFIEFRRLESFDSSIFEDEYRLAVRFPNNSTQGVNYHVIYQLSNGMWAGKDWTEPSKLLGYGNPSITPSMWENDKYAEEAGTIYYALKRKVE